MTSAVGDEDVTPLGIAAARITRMPNGKIYAVNCLLNYGRPVGAEDAVRAVQAGKIAFIRRGDTKAVLDALGVRA